MDIGVLGVGGLRPNDTPAEFRKFMRDEMEDAAKVVKAANIRIQ